MEEPIWPPQSSEMVENFLETGLAIYKETFGSLSQDPASPYSRISVTNSSFSVDPFVGCPARCSYCVVASSARDLVVIDNGGSKPLLPSNPKRLFTGKTLVEALIRHPGFIPNRSVIGIGTGSTESFLPRVEEETWQIMETIALRGLSNPFWIVTKMGISDGVLDRWLHRFDFLRKKGISVVVSVTYSAAPRWMEPYDGDRFQNVELIKQEGVHVSHHLRPIVRGVNDDLVSARRALEASVGLADVICVGGLRPDPGIKLAWQHIYHLNPRLLPATEEKDLPEHYLQIIAGLIKELGLTVPTVQRSSDAISFLLGIPDYTLHRYTAKNDKPFLSVPIEIQQRLFDCSSLSLESIISGCAKSIGLNDVRPSIDGAHVWLNRNLCFQEHNLLIHSIGHSRLLP